MFYLHTEEGISNIPLIRCVILKFNNNLSRPAFIIIAARAENYRNAAGLNDAPIAGRQFINAIALRIRFDKVDGSRGTRFSPQPRALR